MRNATTVVLCLSLALVGCKAKEALDKAAISKDLDKRGTMDLAKEMADDQYEGPADGKLTEAQVKMYLKVREHAKKIEQVAKEEMKTHADDAKKSGEKSIAGMMDGFKALGSAADLMTADLRAAKDLGLNSAEYTWVKSQILSASSAGVAEGFQKTMNANLDKAYAESKKAYDEAKDEPTKQMYAQILAGYDKSREEMKQQQAQQDPAIAYNRQILAKFETELNVFADEMTKFSNDTDAKKAAAEMQKALAAGTK
jgi:hypothetical protein